MDKKTIGFVFAAATILGLALSLLSCATSEINQSAPIGTVGFVQLTTSDSWHKALNASIRSEAATRGFRLHIKDGNYSQSAQLLAINSFVSQRVDFIILDAAAETGWDGALGQAKAAGIPVILVDRNVVTNDLSLYLTFVANNYVLEGQMAADWLVAAVGTEPANIIELEGWAGLPKPVADRKEGFDGRLTTHDNMRIIHSETANFNFKDAKALMGSLLSRYPTCNAVFAQNDQMALGAIASIKAAGKAPGKDILVVSIDGTREALQAVFDGKLGCTVECSPIVGKVVFDVYQKMSIGEGVDKTTFVADELLDKSKIPSQEYISARTY